MGMTGEGQREQLGERRVGRGRLMDEEDGESVASRG